ncbi:MAG: hypothetical protein PHI18_06620 [bacterium]|nr:hypothetical protein [bacterium]
MTDADSLRVMPYDLPDADLHAPDGETHRCRVFVPPRRMAVIGKGSDPRVELNVETILADGIPVMRRNTGGCAVILSPRMLAVAFALFGKQQQKSSDYFCLFNGVIIRALHALGVTELEHAGTSDIARHGRKIAGTAIYRNREVVFYHAIVNVAEDPRMIERYLALPPRMPDYRAARGHADFVTSLDEQGFRLEFDAVHREVEEEYDRLMQPPFPPEA